MSYDIGPKIGIDGEPEFRKAINQMTQNLKTLGTEMGVVTSAFAKNQSSQEALTAKNEVLTRQLSAQREKLDKLKEGLALCTAEWGETDEKTLKWKASVNTAQAAVNKLENEIGDNNQALRDMAEGAEDVGEALEDGGEKALSFGDVLKANVLSDAIVSGFRKLGDGIKSMFQTAFAYNRQMESYTSDFTVMLGDAENAAKKVEELKAISSKTPFELGDLADATKTLLAFQVTSEDSTAVLQQLGDISLGNADKLGTLSRAYGKMNSSGKVTLESINMMIDAGYNPLNNIAERTGETMEGLYARISAGSMSFGEIQQAIADATSEGGQFFQGMQQASTTTDGMISTLKDNINEKLGGAFQGITDKIRTDLLPAAIEFVSSIDTDRLSENIMGFLDTMRQMIPVVTGATAAMLAYKAATAISGLIEGLRKATESQTIAQAALNAVTNANPFVLVASLIAGVVTALVTLYVTNEDFRKKVQEVWAAATAAISGAVAKIKTFFTDTIPKAAQTALNWFKEIPSKLKEVGINIVAGLWNGISSKVQWLKNKISGFCSSAIGAIKNFFGINSPSRVMRDQVGKNLAEGIGVGFTDAMRSVSKSMASAIPTQYDLPDLGGGALQGNRFAAAAREQTQQIIHLTTQFLLDGKIIGESVTQYQLRAGKAAGA